MGLFNKTTYNVEKTTNEKDVEIAKAQAEASKSGDRVYAEALIKKELSDDQKERPWAHDTFFYTNYQMLKIAFPDTTENIAKTSERMMNEVKRQLNDFDKEELGMGFGEVAKFMIYGWIPGFSKIVQGFIGEPKICKEGLEVLDKAQQGIVKIQHIDNSFNSAYLTQQLAETRQFVGDIKNKNKKVFMTKGILAIGMWTALCLYASLRR